jgi:hypothetical protein
VTDHAKPADITTPLNTPTMSMNFLRPGFRNKINLLDVVSTRELHVIKVAHLTLPALSAM